MNVKKSRNSINNLDSSKNILHGEKSKLVKLTGTEDRKRKTVCPLFVWRQYNPLNSFTIAYLMINVP